MREADLGKPHNGGDYRLEAGFTKSQDIDLVVIPFEGPAPRLDMAIEAHSNGHLSTLDALRSILAKEGVIRFHKANEKPELPEITDEQLEKVIGGRKGLETLRGPIETMKRRFYEGHPITDAFNDHVSERRIWRGNKAKRYGEFFPEVCDWPNQLRRTNLSHPIHFLEYCTYLAGKNGRKQLPVELEFIKDVLRITLTDYNDELPLQVKFKVVRLFEIATLAIFKIISEHGTEKPKEQTIFENRVNISSEDEDPDGQLIGSGR